MKVLVIYDSKFGNTQRIAGVIAEVLGVVTPFPVEEVSESDLDSLDLLAVGGPTQGHGMSPALKVLLARLPAHTLWGASAVTFDTRLTWPKILAGSAAAAAARQLTKKGARMLLPPESFLVKGTEGPLVDGELERAHAWANEVRVKASLPERELVGAAP
jgi:flavodoxin